MKTYREVPPSVVTDALTRAHKLIESAQARWRAVNAPHPVALVRAGAKFTGPFPAGISRNWRIVDSQLAEAITRLYTVFDRYPRPAELAICPMCATADVDPARLAHADVRDWSDADLVAIHVLSLPDDALRHFLPRVFEALLGDQWAAFEFGLNGLKGRTTGWPLAERNAIDNVLKTAWAILLAIYPTSLGYVSSAADLLELADQLDLPIPNFLDIIDHQPNPATDLHLASLIEFAYTTSDKATAAPIKAWLTAPTIGARLEEAFYHATDDTIASTLATAHELWQTCTPGATNTPTTKTED